ncbi:Structural maintenance of chromosomes protein 5 [Mycena sanguinolenta]|uniref:Structural maintenance of chromosomes protein 5 n=1 Tax=Mycena sanguinolenta TaxID=230812 RepID=A0A8H6ZAT5_9AGAR|nr:Structural maintenance of chromosomes protein 5 [Mycena sanguinolenta]
MLYSVLSVHCYLKTLGISRCFATLVISTRRPSKDSLEAHFCGHAQENSVSLPSCARERKSACTTIYFLETAANISSLPSSAGLVKFQIGQSPSNVHVLRDKAETHLPLTTMVRRPDSSSEEDATPAPAAKIDKGKGKAREQPEQEEMSRKGAKRARKNEAGDAVAQHADEPDADHDEPLAPRRVKTLPRDVDGFIPGSIMRIQLRKFVTYDFVEFRPGPYLNMVLGPNGTGKSSIACAICIGLNWPPKILGRSTDLREFVKDRIGTGHIEIELKAPGENLVIRRNLSAESKSSTFTLNGRPATGHEITARVAQLNVQVGNLCSFLPQDKVSAFAAMTPVELLKETENAAGDEGLRTWHETLIEAGAQLKELREKIHEETATMRQLQDRNDNIERDVQRYRDRKQIERNIMLLNALIPVQQYREARIEYFDLKDQRRASHEKVSKLIDKNKPAHELLKDLETQVVELHAEREAAKKTLRDVLKKVEQKTQASEALEAKSEDIQTALGNLKRNEKERLATIKRAEAQIVKLKADMEKEVKTENEADVKAERTRAQTEFAASSYHMERHTKEQKTRALGERKARNARVREDAEKQLRDLDSIDSRKLNKLQQWDRDAADAVRWLRANRDKFRMEVFEPAVLSVTVPNSAFAAAVERCFGSAQLRTFVFQCQEDYNTFNTAINDNPGLGRRARVPTWFRLGTENDLTPPPMPRDEAYPAWRELNMHRTAISLRGIQDVQGAIDAVGRPGPNGRTADTTFVDRETVHQVSRSKYGNRELGTSVSSLRKARNFGNNVQVNPTEKKRIDDILQRCREEDVVIHEGERENELEAKQLEKVGAEHNNVMAGFVERLKAISQGIKRKLDRETKLASVERTLVNALKKGNAAEEGARLRAQLMNIAKKRIKLVAEAVEFSRDVVTEQTKATTVGLQYIQICAKTDALRELCDRKDAKYKTALQEFNTLDAEFLKVKAEANALRARIEELLLELPLDLRTEYHVQEQAREAYDKAVKAAAEARQEPPVPGADVDLRTLAELEAELARQEADLDMNANTNPGVVEQYEKRKKEIEVLEKTIESGKRQEAKIEKKVKNARNNWEPALRALVASIGKKFSAAFDRIGCAGEIRIREDGSFALWAIDILVKFRDTEKLQLLTSQRQSGGERSLTTILYLMSLTEEARAPFSLVDEINQGMDQRAERMVHNSMVEATCKPDSAQYFLITPKLLPDLQYHERMKILCVNNGEWLPDNSDESIKTKVGNMMSMIDSFLAAKK